MMNTWIFSSFLNFFDVHVCVWEYQLVLENFRIYMSTGLQKLFILLEDNKKSKKILTFEYILLFALP